MISTKTVDWKIFQVGDDFLVAINFIYLVDSIEAQRNRIIAMHGRPTKYLFPIFTGTQESYVEPAWTLSEIKKLCLSHGIQGDDGKLLNFSWHQLRHTKGTSMAADGHDVLSIMMELGHTSPDMATVYINNRLELKKKALQDKGNGRFFDIEGKVDPKIGDLLVKKGQLKATRVCGGACSMPAQIGDWCQHANACYTCKYFRADSNDLDFFKSEQKAIIELSEQQKQEINDYKASGRTRLAEITERRQKRNKDVACKLGAIVKVISKDKLFKGTEQKFKRESIEHE